MSYLVLARKYRPQLLGDLAGQSAIAKTLANAIEQNRLSHAVILCGPRGVGKTSTARILAKSLNCSVSPGANPCGTCNNCISITNDTNMDVIEIDGASHNGVENIRSMIDTANITPAASKYKIYIIDEVHMLSRGAFNALLKTLEEPPHHVKFILATTEIHKVPETIRSRTQRFDFKLVPTTEVVNHLKYICKEDDIEYEEDAIATIAAGGRGSIRDSLTLLDQAIVYAGGTITAETVTMMTGSLTFKNTIEIGNYLIQNNGSKALEVIDQLITNGIAVEQIFTQLIELFRAIMIAPENPSGMEGMFNFTTEQLSEVKTIKWSQESAIYALQILNKSRSEAKVYPEPRIALEISIIRLSRIENIIALGDIVSGKAKFETPKDIEPRQEEVKLNPPITPATAQPIIAKAPEKKTEVKPKPEIKVAPAVPVATPKPEPKTEPAPKQEIKKEEPKVLLEGNFNTFINEVSQRFPSFAKLLSESKHQEDKNVHRFIIKGADPFKMERLCARSEKLEIALKKVYGDNASLELEAFEEDAPVEEAPAKTIAFAPRAAPLKSVPTPTVAPAVDLPWDNSTPQPLQAKQPQEQGSSASSLLSKANQNKNVQALKDAFSCNIVNVTEIDKE